MEYQKFKGLKAFKKNIGYPEHGIILEIKDKNNMNSIFKDFANVTELDSQVKKALEKGLTVSAKTDMRATHNPTRMLAIEQAVIDLLKNIKSSCPKCSSPGFAMREVNSGLHCEMCHLPTKSAKSTIYRCQKCDFSEERSREDKFFEDPTYCDFCNP